MASSLTTNDEPHKRLIIKISYRQKHVDDSVDDDHSQKRRKMEHGKPIVSTYWLDSTISLSQHKKNNVVAHTDQSKKKEPTTTTVSTKDYVGNFGCKNFGPKTTNVKDHLRAEKYGFIKNDDGEEEVIKKVKKPMERYKKMQCWVILKRMLEGRDGWALKYPLDHKYLEGLSKSNRLENKSNKSKLKAIGLKDIETKLKLYSTPEEFADDMRFVFSQGLLYPTRDVVHKIAMKFSETFENKWKSLNEEWTLEERNPKGFIRGRGNKLFMIVRGKVSTSTNVKFKGSLDVFC